MQSNHNVASQTQTKHKLFWWHHLAFLFELFIGLIGDICTIGQRFDNDNDQSDKGLNPTWIVWDDLIENELFYIIIK